MECAALLSYLVTQALSLFRVTGFKSAGFDRCAIVMVRQQTWQENQTFLINRRWSVMVGIANAISKPGVFCQASIAGQLFQTAGVSTKGGGR
jgi:hypothetical protein